MIAMLVLFLALVAAHALCDYPLQGDFLSKAKNRAAPIPGVPWWQALGAHAAIHGGAVGWLTGVWWLGLAEAATHAVIDDLKCRTRLTFNQDQALHIACKVLWVAIAASVVTACATAPPPEPKVRPVEVKVAVPVSCVPPGLAPPPTYADTDAALKAAPDAAARYQLLASEHSRRVSREDILEAVVDACRKAAPAP